MPELVALNSRLIFLLGTSRSRTSSIRILASRCAGVTQVLPFFITVLTVRMATPHFYCKTTM
jgi:hypothetical protein